MKPPVDDWFNNAIVDGVMLLHSLCLDGRPAAEVVTLTAAGWIEVLWRGGVWRQEVDAQRLPAAFFGLARAVDCWPAPRQLLAHLPPLAPAPALTEVVQPPSAERRAALAAMRRRLADRLLSIPGARAPDRAPSDEGACPGGQDAATFFTSPPPDADRAERQTSCMEDRQ